MDTSSPTCLQCTDATEFLRILHGDQSVFEIRSLKCPEWRNSSKRSTASGWFTCLDAAATAVSMLEDLEPAAIYCTLNPTLPLLVGRCHNKIKFGGSTTSDKDIVRRTAILIDIDPIRPANISSTQRQVDLALKLANKIEISLLDAGWPEPLKGMSGNGSYLIYRLDLDPDDNGLISECLQALSERFSDELVSVDTSTANAARLVKILGTVARKGDHIEGVPGIEDMPHRRSWFYKPDRPLEVVRLELLQELAGTRSKAAATAPKSNGRPVNGRSEFDVERWLSDHNVPVNPPAAWQGGRKWSFSDLPALCRNAPSGHDHDGSGFICQKSDGTLSAGCLHDRCTWQWQELREHYEPKDNRRKKTHGAEVGGRGNQHAVSGQVDHLPNDTTAAEVESLPRSQAIVESDANDRPGAEPPATAPAEAILASYLRQINEGKLPQLLPQREALAGIEIGPELFTIIGAPPGAGKTALVMQIMFDGLELDESLRTVVANAEMTFECLLRRELSRRTRIDSDSIRFGNLSAGELERIHSAASDLAPRLERVSVLNDPCNVMQLWRLRDEAPGLLIVDYLQKFAPSDKDARAGVNEVVKVLRSLAKLGWSVVALSATKRDSKGKHSSKELDMASFRESGDIEFNADSAYVLQDMGPLATDYIRHVTLGHVKNRHGPKVDKQLRFHMPRMEFTAFETEPQGYGDFGPTVDADDPFSLEAS